MGACYVVHTQLEERLSALTVIVTEAEQQRIKNTERQQSLCSLLSIDCCLRHSILCVAGWTAEVKKLKQRLMQVEKERGITQKLCQDQENELLVSWQHYCTCLFCYPVQLQRNSQEELNQNISKLSAEVSISTHCKNILHDSIHD